MAPIVTELNTSTFVEISVGPDRLTTRNISLHTEDLSAFIIKESATGTEAVIPTGNMSIANVSSQGSLLYAKALSGTPNLVMLTGLTI